jgi:hypothetical protein
MYAMASGPDGIVPRMRRTAIGVAAAVLALGGTAAADDRTPTLDVEAAAALVIPHAPEPDASYEDPQAFGMVRAMLAWDEPAAEMPAQRGYAWRGSISPEIGVGLLDHEGQGDGLVEAGLRLHLSFAQREMGLFRVSAKGGMWLAGRGGIVGQSHTPMAEVSIGWYLWLGSSWRVGWEVGGVALRNDPPMDSTRWIHPEDSVLGLLHCAMFVGVKL